MTKFLALAKREYSGSIKRSIVLLNGKLIPFEVNSERKIYLHEGVKYDLEIFAYGDQGGKCTVSIKRKTKDLLVPLVCEIETDLGGSYSHDDFTPNAEADS